MTLVSRCANWSFSYNYPEIRFSNLRSFTSEFIYQPFRLGLRGFGERGLFRHMGHKVTGVDISKTKVEMLESGQAQLLRREWRLVAEANKSCRLRDK